MNITADNVEKVVDNLKEDLKIERFSDHDLLLDELVSAFINTSELEEANEQMSDTLKDIKRMVEDA